MSPRFQQLIRQSKNVIMLDSEIDYTTNKIKEIDKLNTINKQVSQVVDEIDF